LSIFSRQSFGGSGPRLANGSFLTCGGKRLKELAAASGRKNKGKDRGKGGLVLGGRKPCPGPAPGRRRGGKGKGGGAVPQAYILYELKKEKDPRRGERRRPKPRFRRERACIETAGGDWGGEAKSRLREELRGNDEEKADERRVRR